MARISRKPGNAKKAPIKKARIYNTAAYVRLSDEDIRKKISASIGTQKAMLINRIQAQEDLRLFKVYEDVNYTGANFNRPGFSAMLNDIHKGLIDCVVVKDLSRLGRSFEEMGNYLERVFPHLGVRFIAIGDNYDSLTASLDESSLIVPLKNLMNEIYARDISRKVQQSVKQKQKRGEFVGSVPPYGYQKSGTGLVVDEEAAPVVRLIFGWVSEGMSDVKIAQKLNGMKIHPPSRYRFEKGMVKAKRYADVQYWCKSTVKRITENPAYTGIMAQGRYKSKYLSGGGVMHTDSAQWIIVEDAHPAIIDTDTFEAVRDMRRERRP